MGGVRAARERGHRPGGGECQRQAQDGAAPRRGHRRRHPGQGRRGGRGRAGAGGAGGHAGARVVLVAPGAVPIGRGPEGAPGSGTRRPCRNTLARLAAQVGRGGRRRRRPRHPGANLPGAGAVARQSHRHLSPADRAATRRSDRVGSGDRDAGPPARAASGGDRRSSFAGGQGSGRQAAAARATACEGGGRGPGTVRRSRGWDSGSRRRFSPSRSSPTSG